MDPLLPSFRRELRARAHHLHPVVSVGQHGLTPSVLHEIDVALSAHELVKVRVFSDAREEREALLVRACNALDCAAVQQIGKLLILWRPRAIAAAAEPAPGSSGNKKGRRVDRHPRQQSAPPSRLRTGSVKDSPSLSGVRARKSQGVAAPAGSVRVRKSAGIPPALAGGRRPPGKAAVDASPRGRKSPGKAPAGVPRAAAPRRRRRGA
jgi:putative YhbY family RNA-binding protein